MDFCVKRLASSTLRKSMALPPMPVSASMFEERSVPSPKNLRVSAKSEKPTEIGRSRT
jgi:hypothetical protein